MWKYAISIQRLDLIDAMHARTCNINHTFMCGNYEWHRRMMIENDVKGNDVSTASCQLRDPALTLSHPGLYMATYLLTLCSKECLLISAANNKSTPGW